jgi:mRNA interferase MazF
VPKLPAVGWHPKRGEIYLIEVQAGGQAKRRPFLVISIDPLNRQALDVCVVPITSIHHREFRMRVPISQGEGGLDKPSWAKCDQVTTLEKACLNYPPIGTLSGQPVLREIENQVRFALGLG